MMKNVFFVKFILLIIIVTNATAYDTCLSPRTKDQDCDCDILTNGAEGWSIGGRAKGAMIEFAICRNYKGKIPLQVLVTPYDPANAIAVYENGRQTGTSHWWTNLSENSIGVQWKPWTIIVGTNKFKTMYCPDITVAGNGPSNKQGGYWKKDRNGEYQPTDLNCPEHEKTKSKWVATIKTYDLRGEQPQDFVGVSQTFCPTSGWYKFSYIFKGFEMNFGSISSVYRPTWQECPRKAAPCDANDDREKFLKLCACTYFGDDEVCKNYIPPTKAPKEAPTTIAPRKTEKPQTVGEKKDNGKSENVFGWVIFALTMAAAAGMIFFCCRSANSDFGKEGGVEMHYEEL